MKLSRLVAEKDVADNEEFISTLILTHTEYTRTIYPWRVKDNCMAEREGRYVKDKDTKETWSQASRNQVRGGLLGQSTDARQSIAPWKYYKDIKVKVLHWLKTKIKGLLIKVQLQRFSEDSRRLVIIGISILARKVL